ncbi:MAG: polysaccharide deacetylase family protein [Paucibacter sp.]|nr:polysaccharide deacetylase family protein [Roseateles sp.]
MSVQFLRAWGGYEQHQVVHTLPANEEARLVGLGLCRTYFGGIDTDAPFNNAAAGKVAAGMPLGAWSDGALSSPGNDSAGMSVAVDASMPFNGQPSLKITQGGAGTVIARWTPSAPFSLGQLKSLQIPVRVSRNANDSGSLAVFGGANSLYVWLVFTDGKRAVYQIDMTGFRAGQWHVLSLPPGSTAQGWTFAGGPTDTSYMDTEGLQIAHIQFLAVATAGQTGEVAWVGPIRRGTRSKGCSVVTMDGAYASQHNYMLPMLEDQGLKATLFVQVDQIGQAGRMTWAQVDRAYAAGHQVACWGYAGNKNGYASTVDFPDGYTDVRADIAQAIATLEARGYADVRYACHNGSAGPWWAAAQGKTRQDKVARALVDAGIKAARYGSIAGGAYDRLQPLSMLASVDPLTLQGVIQVTNTTTAAIMQAQLVDWPRDRGELAIGTFHRSVVGTPTAAVALEILNSDFATFAAYLGQEVRRGVVDNMTFAAVCKANGIA